MGATADALINQATPDSNGGASHYLYVTPKAGGNNRALLRFQLPDVPVGCAVSSATLELYDDPPTTGRTIEVYRADPAVPWTESGVTWNVQPPTAGTPATSSPPSSPGYQMWTVTDQVRLLYSAGNNGFVVKDRNEGDDDYKQTYLSRAGWSPPRLTVTWG